MSRRLAVVPQPGDPLARLGQNVRAYRVAAGLTQAALAKAVGLSRTSITNTEAGRQDTTVTGLIALATALDTTAGALLGEEPGQPIAPVSLLARVAGQQRRISSALAEAAEVMHGIAKDADEMRGWLDALRNVHLARPTTTEDTP